MNMLDFGVFYTCYTEISAVNHSIMVLKKIYPEERWDLHNRRSNKQDCIVSNTAATKIKSDFILDKVFILDVPNPHNAIDNRIMVLK